LKGRRDDEHDLNETSLARGGEADTSVHQQAANTSIRIANADALAGPPSPPALRSQFARPHDASR
jgi:hypothetical protein